MSLTLPVMLAGCATPPASLPTGVEYIKPVPGETSTAYMGDAVIKSTTGLVGDALELGSAKGTFSTVASGTYCHAYGDVYRNYDNPLAVGLINIYGHVVNYQDYVTYDAAKNTVSPPNHTTYTSSEISIKRVPDGVCKLSNAPVKSIEYNGNAGGVMKFTYREISVTRGETTSDFTIDAKGSDIVTYKGARFKVISADNTAIKYTVLYGFTRKDKL
ncbi:MULTISPECIES: hypothetical protein [Erwiniaceae]|uniref:hypothetical protein n=1 Tax=Erwiniaceae TaxID=1903409 RepID=UPI001EF10919|nr:MULTISPECIES: hypothetical protein [Erwiniaceae]